MADRAASRAACSAIAGDLHLPQRRDGGRMIALALAVGGIAASVGGVLFGIYRATR
ncbi:MAG: hypothetical protein WA622_22585 [Mycobacterium sp.]|uniref:hypothetical protein n=1 Tax=Mycobacterium sp. TaxID=1785 RepID=UPI003BB6E785